VPARPTNITTVATSVDQASALTGTTAEEHEDKRH
jgi:hypothetical protein